MHELPPFPVDDGTLDMLWTAIHPGHDAERSSLCEFLDLYSELGGSDIEAVTSEEEENGITFRTMRDQRYHENCVLSALIEEVRRLRKPTASVEP